jgi:signal transduction histidine kinase
MSVAPALLGWILAAAAASALVIARRSLDERLARACHELRGPLTAVRLGLSLGVRDAALSGPRLRAIDAELERAAAALDDLAALRNRALPFELVDVGEVVGHSVAAWEPVAAAGGVAVERVGAADGVGVWATRARLAQAIGNLLANAIGHGASRVRVTIGAQEGVVRVEIADDGPGLPAPVSELVRRGRRARGAHGHGLAVAAQVAKGHHGRLLAAPALHGARLVLELPRATGSPTG